MQKARNDATPARQGNDHPSIRRIVDALMDDFLGTVTLLAVSPNSEAVTRAALEVSHEANMPMLFAATLNQVDRDAGYTGWTPESFTEFIKDQSVRIGLGTRALVCLDHGGPWLKDHHTTSKLSFEDTWDEVKRSLDACIDAGYALLHIDPTVDRTLPADDPLPVEHVVERTVALIEHAETYRKRRGKPAIGYEVGTEEVHGGLADMRAFELLLAGLKDGLRSRRLEEAWPCFVVGKTGTELQTTYFDPNAAARLAATLKPYRSLLKGHYTDYVDDPHRYPLSDVGGANVGPEFTEEEFLALQSLQDLEKRIGKSSGFDSALKHAVVENGTWRKWLTRDEQGAAFDDLEAGRRQWLLRTCSRYIWTDESVRNARADLYNNVREHRSADRFVIWRIKTVMMRYVHAFNLVDFNDRLGAV